MIADTFIEDNKATIKVEGELNALTASDLQDVVNELSENIVDIDIDLSDTTYVSSAGIRVFVGASKLSESRDGKFRVLHPQEDVYDVFQMTGLDEAFIVVM